MTPDEKIDNFHARNREYGLTQNERDLIELISNLYLPITKM